MTSRQRSQARRDANDKARTDRHNLAARRVAVMAAASSQSPDIPADVIELAELIDRRPSAVTDRQRNMVIAGMPLQMRPSPYERVTR